MLWSRDHPKQAKLPRLAREASMPPSAHCWQDSGGSGDRKQGYPVALRRCNVVPESRHVYIQ